MTLAGPINNNARIILCPKVVFGQHKAHFSVSWQCRVTRETSLLTSRQVTYLNSVVMPDEAESDSDEEEDDDESDDGESSGAEDESES
jgi:hypothetical protein